VTLALVAIAAGLGGFVLGAVVMFRPAFKVGFGSGSSVATFSNSMFLKHVENELRKMREGLAPKVEPEVAGAKVEAGDPVIRMPDGSVGPAKPPAGDAGAGS